MNVKYLDLKTRRELMLEYSNFVQMFEASRMKRIWYSSKKRAGTEPDFESESASESYSGLALEFVEKANPSHPWKIVMFKFFRCMSYDKEVTCHGFHEIQRGLYELYISSLTEYELSNGWRATFVEDWLNAEYIFMFMRVEMKTTPDMIVYHFELHPDVKRAVFDMFSRPNFSVDKLEWADLYDEILLIRQKIVRYGPVSILNPVRMYEHKSGINIFDAVMKGIVSLVSDALVNVVNSNEITHSHPSFCRESCIRAIHRFNHVANLIASLRSFIGAMLKNFSYKYSINFDLPRYKLNLISADIFHYTACMYTLLDNEKAACYFLTMSERMLDKLKDSTSNDYVAVRTSMELARENSSKGINQFRRFLFTRNHCYACRLDKAQIADKKAEEMKRK